MESTPWIVSPGSDGEQARDSSQQQPSPARLELTVARADGLPRLRTLFLKKERKYYVTATDGLRTEKTLAIRSTAQSVQWDKTLSGLTINSSSPLIVRVFARRTWLRDVRLGLLTIPFETIRSSPLQEFNIPFDSRNMTLVLSITLPEASQHATSGDVSSPKTLRAPILSKGSDPGPPAGPIISSDDSDPADPMQVAERRLARAGEAVANLGNVQSFPLELAKVADEAPDQLQKAADLYDTWKEVLDNVKIVVDMVDKIAEIHPYAKMAWSILSCIPRTLIAQIERDKSFKDLLNAIRDAFDLAKQAEELKNFLPGSAQVKILKEMLRHVGACGDLIHNYAKDTTFWKRLVTNLGGDASGQVKGYSETLAKLRGALLDHATINTQMAVAALSSDVAALSGRLEEVASGVTDIGLDVKMANIPFPEGARHGEDKRCIPGTRMAFLDHITSWVNNPDSLRALVLFGQAGTGKSSIANELACQFEATDRLASSFVFSRTERTEQSHRAAQRLFSGIARNLADRYPTFKASLAKIIDEDASLVHGARDRTTPFKSMLLRPLQESPLIGPVFIVIDALDESGDASGRDGLHSFLASHVSQLPDTFRILITSRPEKDIVDAFSRPDSLTMAEIRHMDDPVLSRQTGDDIYAFVRHQLRESPHLLEQYGDELAKKAEKSFQWAAVACNHIQFGPAGLTPGERADQLLELPSEGSGSVNLLDVLYRRVLSAYFGKTPPSKFTSVMGQIIAAFEPLSTSSLATLRSYNDPPDLTGEESVRSVVGYLGALLSNVASSESSLPIVPLHTSFRDFLTDPKRSRKFSINLGDAHYQLTRCSFGLMHKKLKRNICELPSSYDRNPYIKDHSSRVTEHISDALSYACRSWDDHLEHVSPDKIVDDVESFFKNDLLHWLEAMSLLGAINLVPQAMSIVGTWVAEHRDNHHMPELRDTLAAWITDTLKFVKYFGRPIAQSAPHIYLSALPFCPETSIISDHYAKYFPNTLSLQRGRMSLWPVQEMAIPIGSSCYAIAFSPDGSRIASGSIDKTVRVWDAETGHPVGEPFTGHTNWVTSVAFSPDGRRIASGSLDRTIRVWDAETGNAVGEPFMGHTRPVYSVAFSPDGRRIASGSHENTIRVWDAETGHAVPGPFMGRTCTVISVTFSPDGRRIASGSDDDAIRIWDAQTGHPVGEPFTGHTDSVTSVAFSPDGRRIASGSHDNTIRVWDTDTGHPVGEPFTGHTNSVSSVVFSPDGSRIASGSHDWTIRVWDTEMGHPVGESFTGHTNRVTSVAFPPDGRRIASASYDCTIRIWNAESGHPVREPFTGHTNWVNSVAFSPDGRQIASGSEDHTIRVWGAETGNAVGEPITSHIDRVSSVAFSPDGHRIVSGSGDHTIRVWDAETGHPVGEPFTSHTDRVVSVAFSPDGLRIASGSEDHTVRVWDAKTGCPVGEPFTGHTSSVNSVAFSPDGRLVASGSEDHTIRVWGAGMGNAVAGPFMGHTSAVYSVAFSPDGRRIASGSEDHTIRIWDAETGLAVAGPFTGHTRPVNSVAFSPDGRRIASGSHDETICVWDAETGREVAGPFAGHTSWVISVAFSPDGRHIASGSYDKCIRLWEVIIHSAAEHSGRSSTPQDILTVSGIAVQGQPSFTDQSAIDNEGWICGANGELLMWIPEPHRVGLHRPSNVWVAAEHETVLDLSRFVHGRDWMLCGGQMTQ